MADSDDYSGWMSTLGSLAGSPTQRSSLPTLTPPNSLSAYSSLFALGTPTASPLTSLLTQPIARPLHALTVPTYQAPAAPSAAMAKPQWIHVVRRFDSLIEAININDDEVADGRKKLGRVIGSLNRCYYDLSSDTANMLVLGSWAKQTRVRPFSDIDVLFIMPYEVYQRFENRVGNRQSQMLQEVRANLKGTYPRTDIRGDGQVVIVNVDGVTIEVVPAILLQDGRYWICDTNNEGRYKLADPASELKALQTADTVCKGNARQLTRLLKKWKIENRVPIKAFQFERLVTEFLVQWKHNQRDRFWWDWMMRDFFLFMVGRANGFVTMPGTGELVPLGADWLPKAWAAYASALKACVYEQGNFEALAGKAWQEIFGSAAPVTVS